ncbi:MAG: hypothetical protein WBE76_27600, partial [Terracidiphilus sp.]
MIEKILSYVFAAAFAATAVQACHSATPPVALPAMHFAQTAPAATQTAQTAPAPSPAAQAA